MVLILASQVPREDGPIVPGLIHVHGLVLQCTGHFWLMEEYAGGGEKTGRAPLFTGSPRQMGV